MSDTRTVVYVHSSAPIAAQVQRDPDGTPVDIRIDIGDPEAGAPPVRLYLPLDEADQLHNQITEALANARDQ